MRSLARHLGLAVLLVGACALMGAAPSPQAAKKATPAKTSVKAKPAVRKSSAVAAKPTAVKPATASASAAMRISREPDAGTPVGVKGGAVIEYVEPVLEAVGEPVITVKPDGSVEMFLNGNGQEYATISMGKNGPQVQCAQGPNRGAKAAKAAPAAAPQREER